MNQLNFYRKKFKINLQKSCMPCVCKCDLKRINFVYTGKESFLNKESYAVLLMEQPAKWSIYKQTARTIFRYIKENFSKMTSLWLEKHEVP